MAKNTIKPNTFKRPKKSAEDKKISFRFLNDKRFQLSVGFLLIFSAIFLITSFISYLFTGKADQSVVESMAQVGAFESGLETSNWLGVYGAKFSHKFIFEWFGLSSFLIPPLLFILGYKIVFKKSLLPLVATTIFILFFLFWVSLLMGYILLASEGISNWGFLSGGIGVSIAEFTNSLVGWGTLLLLIFSLIVFIIYFFNVTQLLGLSRASVSTTSGFANQNSELKSDTNFESGALTTEEEEEWMKIGEENDLDKSGLFEDVKGLEPETLNSDDYRPQEKTVPLEVEKMEVAADNTVESPNTSDTESEPEFTVQKDKVEKQG
ncbi:MAG: DNA translocase FtsK 4TM domain-containing protein, partial [Bacteroidetes bacterium]|nr:DNA translocase FtsK 4TM domain-containing protein [Bacteroidota bacterium]